RRLQGAPHPHPRHRPAPHRAAQGAARGAPPPTRGDPMSAPPRTARGSRTRERILAGATAVFAEHGYHEASIVKITEAAAVAQGTFYLYFTSKQEVFEEVVRDLNSRVRRARHEASSAEPDRRAAGRAGIRASFRCPPQTPPLVRTARHA